MANPPEADCRVAPRVAKGPAEDCCIVQIFANLSVPWPAVQAPATRSQSRSPRFDMQSPPARPNYISQDEDNQPPPTQHTTRSASNSIMQEAILLCVDIYKPKYVLSADLGILNFTTTVPTGTTYTVTPQQMSVHRIPMTWFCEMANLVLGDNGELLEYRHLIANQATWTTWMHSYENKIGRLAQGMPGRNSGTNTIVFIKKNQVPQDRAKDVIYGLITCLIQPEKLDKTNRTRLVVGGRQSTQPGRRRHTYRQPSHHQAPPQQHHQHTQRKIHDHGHQEFLPQHSDGTVQIHATVAIKHARGRHRALQAHGNCDAGQIHLLRDPKENVWLTTGRDHCPTITQRMPQSTRISTEHNHTRPVEARHPPHQLLPRCRRFWGKICGRGERTTPVRHSAKMLQMLMRLGRQTILRTHH